MVTRNPFDPTGNPYLDALVWLTPRTYNPLERSGVTVQWGFGTSGTYDLHDPESTSTSLQATTSTDTERAAVTSALLAWANVADINLVARPLNPDLNPDTASTIDSSGATRTLKFLVTDEENMRAYTGDREILGFSTLPLDYGPNYNGMDTAGYTPGYAVFNQDGYGWDRGGLEPGGYGYVTILHEIGHLLGLDHPFYEHGDFINSRGELLPEPFFPGATGAYKTGNDKLNQGVFTTMTYNDGWTGQPSEDPGSGYQLTPGAFDIYAMQYLYGTKAYNPKDNYELPVPDLNDVAVGWYCIWDTGAGADTIQAPLDAGPATIDLRAATLNSNGGEGAGGYVSWVSGIAGGFTIAHGVLIENATGGNASDKITGNSADNNLRGMGGDDIIRGGAGRDTVSFGSGRDTYVLENTSDSGPAPVTRDFLTDFVHGEDRIDLHLIDANITQKKDQAFVFIGQPVSPDAVSPGTRAYSITWYEQGDQTIIQGDVDGRPGAEFQLELAGRNLGLSASDFIL